MAREILVGALVCLALLLAPAAGAQESNKDSSRDSRNKEYSIDVAQQPLTRALEQLYHQTHVYYGYSPASDAEEQMLVGPVRGRFTIEEALRRLLRPTGLTFSWTNSKTISIERPPPPPPKVRPPPQVKRPQDVQRERRVISAEEPRPDKMEEVITSATLIQPFSAPAAPFLILDQDYIDSTGASTISDLLKYLTQQPYLRSEGSLSNGAQYVELRGLGPDTTMVLINGHRVSPSATSFTANAFDLNQVPLSAVERLEVQLDSVSVRHGADAIGGVINIVLRDDIAHPIVDVRYGSADGGGEQREIAFSAGHKREGVNAAVTLDYRDVGGLFGAQRDLWNNQDYRRFGSLDRRSTLSSPGNVTAVLPGNLPGLSAPFAAIPEHTAGPVTQLGEFRAGDFNYESLFQYIPIVPEDTRASAVASAQVSITPDLVAAVELMAVDRRVRFQSTPSPVAAIVPGTNPYNTFQQPVLVSSLLADTDPVQVTFDSLLIRGAASLRGRANTWDWEVSLLRSEEDAESRIVNVIDPLRLAQVLADPDPTRTVNLLGPGPAATPGVLASLYLPPDIDHYAVDATQLTGFASGRLFALPAGDMSAVIGTEWRKEAVQFDSLLGSFEREVAAGFAELHLPVFGQAMQLPALRELSLTLGGRFDSYSDFGHIFNPQYGLVWKPLREVVVRATYGRSFRPPSLYDLYLPAVPREQAIPDPRRGGAPANVAVTGGGNRELEATRGESFTAGIEFRPEAIELLRLSATYWRVRMDERVAAFPLAFALAHESQLGDRVLRAQPTPEDLAAGRPGVLLALDLSRLNFGRLITSGIDFGAGYEFDSSAGHFNVDVKATWVDEYEALDLPGMPAMDRVNIANSLGTIAKWRAIGTFDWQRGSLGATTHIRYVPAYDDTLGDVRNGRTLPSQVFLDFQLALDLWRGLELAVGASNALDERPHFAEVNGIQGYDNSQGDLKGRFWYLRLGKTF
jgi:iron complex outermembrane receptor protein